MQDGLIGGTHITNGGVRIVVWKAAGIKELVKHYFCFLQMYQENGKRIKFIFVQVLLRKQLLFMLH